MKAWNSAGENQLSVEVEEAQAVVWKKVTLEDLKPKLNRINHLIKKVAERFKENKDRSCLSMMNSLLSSLVR